MSEGLMDAPIRGRAREKRKSREREGNLFRLVLDGRGQR
jgi:hypothetical protein